MGMISESFKNHPVAFVWVFLDVYIDDYTVE